MQRRLHPSFRAVLSLGPPCATSPAALELEDRIHLASCVTQITILRRSLDILLSNKASIPGSECRNAPAGEHAGGLNLSARPALLLAPDLFPNAGRALAEPIQFQVRPLQGSVNCHARATQCRSRFCHLLKMPTEASRNHNRLEGAAQLGNKAKP